MSYCVADTPLDEKDQMMQDPDEQQAQAVAFYDSLGQILLMDGMESSVMLARDTETGESQPIVLVRIDGRKMNAEGTASYAIAVTVEMAQHLIQMLATQSELARRMPGSEWVAENDGE